MVSFLNQIIPFLFFAFVASVTPGPANIAIFAETVTCGWRASVKYALGILAGFFIVLLISAVFYSLGVSIINSKLLFPLRIIGSLYLLYIAWKIATAKIQLMSEGGDNISNANFFTGLLIHPLSPKAWLFVFLSYGTFAFGANGFYLVIYCLLFFASAAISMFMWMVAGRYVGINLSIKKLKLVNYFSSLAISVLVIYILVL